MSAQQRLFKPPAYPDEYEAFWRAYPARGGRKGDKQQAYEQWIRLDTTEKRWCLWAAKQLARDVSSDAMVAWDAERFFVAEKDGGKTPRWEQYAEKEMDADRKAIETVTEQGFDPACKEHREQIRTRTDGPAVRVVRMLDEGVFGQTE